MKFTAIFVAAALAAVASAQDLNAFPSCGLTCLTSNLSATGCSLTDFKCACSNQAFIDTSTKCIQSSCSPADQQKSLAAAKALCKSAGVDISPPVSTTAAATSSAPATTSSAAATTSSAAATSEAPSTSSAAPETTSSAAATSSCDSTTLATVVPTGSVPSGNSTNATVTTPPMASQTANAGGRFQAAFSLMGLGLLAAFAL
ncbi:hypothetical protein FN846DRAFT_966155 [Sphaerosporella brunnea]|uniref:CFEM domain-containing protein n=1 Tax=Sphaerosporella brunnea TaxID=1250544 RepID=A0A5J5EL66_9PEZI|nr:hypothetical protein FN846DRAFT_966155 [Sphaerosporella brunnea]